MTRNMTSLALAGAFLAAIASAQFNSGIQGTVTDSTGAVIPGAAVRVTNAATGIVRETVTSAEGVYFVVSLGAGRYRVTVEKPGFTKTEQDGIELSVNETIRIDLLLPVGASAESVTVAARAPLVETEQGRISGRIDSVELRELPLNGRNLYTLIALQPGITGTGTMGSGALGGSDSFTGQAGPQVFASGQRHDANSFTVDDTSVNSSAGGGDTNLSPNADSVEEVRIVANNFSAVEGRNSAAQVSVVTKSGSNELHGGASYYFENNSLSSRNEFEQRTPVYRRNQFGAHLGGPIVRNRTFFFFSYEGLRSSGARGAVEVVETAAFRDFVESTRPNSIAARVLKEFQPSVDPTTNLRDLGSPRPGPNTTGPPDGILDVGSANYVPDAFRNGNQYNARIDHELRPGKDRLYGNFYFTPSRTLTGDIRRADDRPTSQGTTFAGLNYTHIFSPHVINELHAGVMRLSSHQDFPPHPEVPALTITGLTSTISQNFFPSAYGQTSFDYKDILSWTRSSHSIKLGGEARRVRTNSGNTRHYIPTYNFASILNFANDEPIQMTRTVDPRTGDPATNVIGLRGFEWSMFVNDDWKVTRNFTVNIGLRYENFGSPTEVNGLLRNIVFGNGSNLSQRVSTASADVVQHFYPTDNRDFAPRFGFAWNPDGKGRTSIRGGYGMAFNRVGDTPLLNFRGNPPLRAQVNLGLLLGTQFTYSLGDPTKPFNGYPVDPALRQGLDPRNGIAGLRVSLYAVDPNFRTAYAHNWFFGIQRELAPGWALELNYLASAGHHLQTVYNVNRFRGDLLSGTFHGYNPSFSDIELVGSNSNSIYNGATVQLKRAFRRGFNFQAAYTIGRSIDDSDSLGSSTSGNPVYVDADNRRLERGPSGFDVPQKLAFLGIWELPFLRGQKSPLARVFGGWQFSGIGIVQKGTPVDITSSAQYPRGDFNADGNTGDRPNAPAAGIPRGGYSRSAFLTGIFRTTDFPVPVPGTDGGLGRDVFRGPGFAEVDMALAKKFRLTERFLFELRGEAFNAFNRVNLNNPVTDLANSSFGRSTSAQTPRQYEVGMRVTF